MDVGTIGMDIDEKWIIKCCVAVLIVHNILLPLTTPRTSSDLSDNNELTKAMTNQYFSTYVEDLEQEPFDAIDFVERLAWRLTGGKDDINVTDLKTKFEEEIGNLQLLSEQFQSKISSLEQQCSNDKREYLNVLHKLHEQNADAMDKLKQLDSIMQTVSTKVVHLGDQLESVHLPRARANEALQLMKHFDEFLADQPLSSDIFTDPDKLLESAAMIQKLSSISQELAKDKYSNVQIRIAHKYDEIERLMLEEFVRAHRQGNWQRMHEIAAILADFKGYSQCLDAFVEHMQINAFRGDIVFDDILSLCQKTQPMLKEIFPNPDQVMSKLILNLFHGKLQLLINEPIENNEKVFKEILDLQEVITTKLSDSEHDLEAYLTTMYDLYSRTQKLVSNLVALRISGADIQFMDTLVRSVFGRYLETYPTIEQQFLTEQCGAVLSRFYESKNHQKKQIHSGGLQDLKRDIQARLLNVETYGGETFLSEEVAINILQETKNAFQRCQLLCDKDETPKMTETIFDVLLRFLYTEHLDYAIDLSLAGISLAEPKVEPPNYFFSVVQQADVCTRKRADCLCNVESRINLGLERQLNAACALVVKYLSSEVQVIRDSLDGNNLTTLMLELGRRFYKVLLTHIYQFTYNSQGAMLLLCDINEYRKCVLGWKIPEIGEQFEALHALANLLVVVPENLNEACLSQLLFHTASNGLSNSQITLKFSVNIMPNCFTAFNLSEYIKNNDLTGECISQCLRGTSFLQNNQIIGMTEVESTTTTATLAEAERYRTEGNEHFRSHRYHNAIKCYTKSLECHETSPVLANRAQAYLNIKQYERALMDSAKALELDANNVKAIFRYAKALENLHLYETNCVELKLSCGDRDEFLRSKIPLMEIKNIEVVRIEPSEQITKKKLEISPISSMLKSSSLEIPPPPTTSFTFIADFQKLKDKPMIFAEYFCMQSPKIQFSRSFSLLSQYLIFDHPMFLIIEDMSIDENNYGKLFDEIIETEMIKCLITGFDTIANESNISRLVECLVKLADVSRIDIAVLFLDENAKNGPLFAACFV
ncbi:Exocyst complex component 5 [Dirofilaria immitis]|nr:Exocyst complex component 5 [Dirofilaria immitis]